MSFFEKIVFKTFLILALICFCVSSVFADTTHKFYTTLDGGYCNISAGDFTQQIFNSSLNISNSSYKNSYDGSELNTAYGNLYIKYSTSYYNQNTKTWGPSSSQEPFHVGRERTHTCPNNTRFVLNGCTPQCVVDPCKELQGQLFSRFVYCGTGDCPNNDTLSIGNGAANCSKSNASLLPRPDQFAVNLSNSCGGSLEPGTMPTGFKVLLSDNGKTNFPIFCSATYKYTGSSSSPDDEITGVTSLSFSGVTPTTENGPCPSGQKKGSYALADGQVQWICVSDSGSNPPTDPNSGTCPTGQHKDASGNCVADTNPPTDPTDPNSGTCPTGQHKDASGNCVADTTGGGGGGGGGSGGSGGSGSNSPNIDNTKGEAGSGSQTGAGGKATASTAEGCGTPPSCSGDPLQCAAFVQDWKQNCQLMSVSQGDADKANALSKASNDEHKAKLTQQEQKVSGFFGDFKNTANASTTSQCPNDLTLPVMGKSIVLKLSETCSFWRFLRILIIASAYLAAARIVFGSLN